jgi:hypothetical protein
MKLEDFIDNEKINYFIERTDRHISLVKKYCVFLYLYDPTKYNDILMRAIKHDISKYSDQLSPAYIVLTWKYKLMEYGQPVNLPQEIEDEIKLATGIHVKLERHHPAFFANDLIPEKLACQQMTDIDLAEEVCDWMAMAEERKTDVYEWVRENLDVRWEHTEEQVKLIFELLAILHLYNEKYKEL